MNRRNRSLALPLLLVAVALGLTTMLTSPVISNPSHTSPVISNPFHFSNSFLPATLTVRTANAQVAPTAKSFVIMITSNGFDDNASITVNEGDKVSITFIMDQSQISNTSPANHHVITVDGYNVNSADINPTHPNATVTFTATQLGTFYIYCDTDECPVHALMVGGTIEVDPLVASSSTTSTSTSTTQTTSTQTTSASSTTSSTTSSESSSTSTSPVTSTSTSSTVPEFPTFVIPVILVASLVTMLLLLGVARRHRQL